ncbi:hypothetical protein Q5Y75_00125 [Ruegeria sp. 2205SS24-7]|uniref:hypothetical protein n=1 Tax=Ruegeria discodermiae TaxID=3064389 RepID=UPI002741B79E|nr:hypothetical protein [Ruegeria sp. 2205SS24-7]MDP5215613.1 hypothetical protein [Ruegeria sp. 2205SS24-7]
MNLKKNIFDRLPEFRPPDITKRAEISVYMVHNSPDPEDYFFLFNFEEFVDRSNAGYFVRPVLKIFAGRDDFSRTRFAREFREVFAGEFDRMRAELAAQKGKRGWLGWSFGVNSALELVGGLIGNLVLAVALSVGRRVLGDLSLPQIFATKCDEAKLADEIDRTKVKVETALAEVQVTIHPELYKHAYRDGPMGKISGMDREAWPLPDYVRAHLQDERSGSWW